MNRQARLRADVVALAAPGTRRVGTPGHVQAREHLVTRGEQLGFEVELLPYAPHVDDGGLVNVIATLPGAQRDAPALVLGAHYDTCGDQPGADDNAAAVAIALEVASTLGPGALDRDLLLGLWDAEEPPHFLSETMGSTVWYRDQRSREVHAAVVMDLVGHAVPIPGLGHLLAVTGAESDPALPDIVASLRAEGLGLLPILNRYVGDMSDHHVFRVEGRPYLFLSSGQWEHYHMPSDTPDVLDYAKMAAEVDLLLELLPALDRAALDGPPEQHDTLPLELAAARRHLGPMVAAFGLSLDTREDLDRLVGGLRDHFAI